MKNSKYLAGYAVMAGLLAIAPSSQAFTGHIYGGTDPACGKTCCYTVPDMEASGDAFYGPGNWDWCRQDFLNNQADGYGMDKDDWDGGFGWDAACDMNQPFARTLVARVALQTAHPSPPSSTTDWSGAMLRWAPGWAWERIDDLDGRCGNGKSDSEHQDGTIRAFVTGKPAADGTPTLAFFHRLNVMSRAALLLHEARHINFGSHTGANQRDSNWEENGPYRYQAQWALEYAAGANPNTTTKALRCAAQDSAIGIMYGNAGSGLTGDGWAFVKFPDPNFRPDNVECR
jgi:hypothetical protein